MVAAMKRTTLMLLTVMSSACGEERVAQRDVAGIATTVAPTTTAPDTTVATETTTPTEVVDDTVVADTKVSADTAVDVVPDIDTSAPTDTTPEVVVPPPPEVKFVVLGDTGEGNTRQYKVGQALHDRCAIVGCEFAILLGDNIYDAGVESVMDQQWQDKFELPFAQVDMPFYAALGNHDNGGFFRQLFRDTFDGAGAEFERGNQQVQYTQFSTKWKMPGRTYDFVKGPAHFFALDTNDMVWGLIDPGAEARTQIQVDDFPERIAASSSTWTIAFGHHPYLSNGEHGNAGQYEGLEEGITDAIKDIPGLDDLGRVVSGEGVKAALDDVVCGNIDIYFAGHDHSRQWFPEQGDDDPCPGTTFVVSGAGSKLTDLKGSQPTLFQDNTKAGFFWVHLRGADITVEAVDEDGHVQWSWQGHHR